LTEAQINSGLTLHSTTYGGSGTLVNALTLVASVTGPGETGSSAAQTITVTDPPATALLAQFMAASGANSAAAGFAAPSDATASPSSAVLLAQPHG
jgi:hypothetical protein